MYVRRLVNRSALVLSLAGIASPASAQSIDQLYDAAKREGAL